MKQTQVWAFVIGVALFVGAIEGTAAEAKNPAPLSILRAGYLFAGGGELRPLTDGE